MARLNRSDDTTNLGPGQLGISQGDFREQQDVIGDSLRQLGGFPEVEPGAGTVNDPLNAPFVLYVNPYTGRDTFAFGSYAEADDNSVDQELRRIESQRLVCGYTEAAPFRTINRAVIEAGLITSKSYWSAGIVPFQRVCIVLAPGVYEVLCEAGEIDNDANFPAWTADENDDVDDDWLTAFNPASNNNQTKGGIILPRGCSMVSMDLRKTILRPTAGAVPANQAEQATYVNRAAILRVTGEGYYYGFTFMDAEGVERSHHLLTGFEFAYRNQINEFYSKLNRKFTTAAGLTAPATRDTEWEIVGPQPAANPTQATDTTDSASPYIYNCSIRSTFGLGGIFANGNPDFGGAGNGVGGFRSMVVAQYTGTCLQNDLTCFQTYDGANWNSITANDFANYRNTEPDNIRMDPTRRSFHIRAVENAIIQEVSVFAIGQGVHHWVESGGELTVTNSNSNFGGVAALAEGFQAVAFPQDTPHTTTSVKVPTDLSEKRNNIERIFLGIIDASVANTDTAIVLTTDLDGDTDNEPSILQDRGYSLRQNSFLWVENPGGPDYRQTLPATAWDDATPNTINVTAAIVDEDGNAPGSNILIPGVIAAFDNLQAGAGYAQGVYANVPLTGGTGEGARGNVTVNAAGVVTGVVLTNGGSGYTDNDTLSADNANLGGTGAGFSTDVNGVNSPDSGRDRADLAGLRVYVRRLKDTRSTDERRYALIASRGADDRVPLRDYIIQTPAGTADVNTITAVNKAGALDGSATVAEIELRRINPNTTATTETYYRPGDSVRFQNKHWKCIREHVSPAALTNDWRDENFQEHFVHQQDAYNAEDFFKNVQPLIIFDNDTDGAEASVDLGWILDSAAANNVWNPATGGFNAESVERQYTTATDFRGLQQVLTAFGVNGGAMPLPQKEGNQVVVTNANTNVEFRRPSNIRLFGHAYEWTGFSNYTKGIPRYQGEMSAANKFTYYATDEMGGRVYFSGFNEEGFTVSPRGVEDIQTGDIVSVEEVGAPDRPIDFPTFFDNLTVNNLAVNQNLNLNNTVVDGNPVFQPGVLPEASMTQAGIIRVATQAETDALTADNLAVSPATLPGVLATVIRDVSKSIVNARLSISPTTPVPGQQPTANADAPRINSDNIFLHPYNGNEISLFDNASQSWYFAEFGGVLTFSLAGLNNNTQFDVYIRNTGTVDNPTLGATFAPWPNDSNPPARGNQNGVPVRNGLPEQRLIGVVRTTGNNGQTTQFLGGQIASATAADNVPQLFLANYYNLYDARLYFVFANNWNQQADNWRTPPGYGDNARLEYVLARESRMDHFYDMYSNGDNIIYAAVGLDNNGIPPRDHFQVEVVGNNISSTGFLMRTLAPGRHRNFYLYRNGIGNVAQEHLSHGMACLIKV